MAYGTRRAPAEIGRHADDRDPYYHESCVPLDALGHQEADEEGRPRVWILNDAPLADEPCHACGRRLGDPAPVEGMFHGPFLRHCLWYLIGPWWRDPTPNEENT